MSRTGHWHAAVKAIDPGGAMLPTDYGPPVNRDEARAAIAFSLSMMGAQVERTALVGGGLNGWSAAAQEWNENPETELVKVGGRTYLVVPCACASLDTSRLAYEDDPRGRDLIAEIRHALVSAERRNQ